MRFKDKIVVITGAASGIGRASVMAFAAEGATVIAGDINEAAGETLAAQTNGNVLFCRCDVTNVTDIKALMDYAGATFGGIDVLYNNAGAPGPATPIDEIEPESWDRVMALILRSVAMGIRYATPHMSGREGAAIINTASIAGHRSGLGNPAYSVAKAGVVHLTVVAAANLARHDIRVNSISPGFINSNLFAEVLNLPPEEYAEVQPVLAEASKRSQPVKRAGMPEDIAAMALFLASSEAAFITGADMVVDGGAVMGERRAWDPDIKSPFAHLARPRT